MAASHAQETQQQSSISRYKRLVLISAAISVVTWILVPHSWPGEWHAYRVHTEAWLGTCGISLRHGRRAQVAMPFHSQATQ